MERCGLADETEMYSSQSNVRITTLVTMLVTMVIVLASSVSLVSPAHSWRYAAINPSIMLISS